MELLALNGQTHLAVLVVKAFQLQQMMFSLMAVLELAQLR